MDKLPKGWNYKRLDNISKVVSGYAFPSTDFIKEGIYKTIKITNVGVQEFIEVADDDRLPLKYDDKFSSFRINTNDIVIALTRSIINDGLKVALVPQSYNNSFLNQRVAAIKSEYNLNSFIYYFLRSTIAYNYVQGKSRSLNQPNLSINDLKAIQIPFPPVSEQTRIVSKLDSLFSRIDKSITLLEENINYTKALMANILEEAFDGFDKNVFKPLFEVCSVYNGTIVPKDEEIYNYVGLENIESVSGKLIDFTPSVGKSIKSSKVKFDKGAVLYGKLRPYLNKVLVATFDGIATTEILPLNPNRKILNPFFLCYFLRSPGFVNLVNSNTSGTRMPRAATNFFKTIAKVPVPDIEIQLEVSRKLDFVSQKSDQLLTEQQSKLAYLKALKSSLLDRAFKGEL